MVRILTQSRDEQRARLRPYEAAFVSLPRQSIEEVTKILQKNQILSVPMTDRGRLVGIVSRSEVVKAVLEPDGFPAQTQPFVKSRPRSIFTCSSLGTCHPTPEVPPWIIGDWQCSLEHYRRNRSSISPVERSSS